MRHHTRSYNVPFGGLLDAVTLTVDQRNVRGASITCGFCGHAEAVRNNTINGGASGPPGETSNQETRLVTRKFERRGWAVGGRRRDHRCPTCSATKQEPTVASAKVVEMTAPTQPAPPLAPREMTREDRRLIFAKLEEVYADEKTGYSAGWTDKRVAEDQGAPQAWVAKIRDENFGPHGSNPDIDNAIVRGNEVVTECRALAQKLLDAAAAVERRIIDLSRTVRP